jgi:hypothetical protein
MFRGVEKLVTPLSFMATKIGVFLLYYLMVIFDVTHTNK